MNVGNPNLPIWLVLHSPQHPTAGQMAVFEIARRQRSSSPELYPAYHEMCREYNVRKTSVFNLHTMQLKKLTSTNNNIEETAGGALCIAGHYLASDPKICAAIGYHWKKMFNIGRAFKLETNFVLGPFSSATHQYNFSSLQNLC